MAEAFPTIVHLLGSCPAIIHLLGSRVARLALCICGTLGKGTLCMYPSLRVPTLEQFVMFGNLFRYKPTTRRLVPIFYAQTIWLLHCMLQMYATQQKTSILNNNHPTKNNTMVEPVAGLAARL